MPPPPSYRQHLISQENGGDGFYIRGANSRGWESFPCFIRSSPYKNKQGRCENDFAALG